MYLCCFELEMVCDSEGKGQKSWAASGRIPINHHESETDALAKDESSQTLSFKKEGKAL